MTASETGVGIGEDQHGVCEQAKQVKGGDSGYCNECGQDMVQCNRGESGIG